MAQVERLSELLAFFGDPLEVQTLALLEKARACEEPEQAVRMVQEALDPLCLVMVQINPESRVKVLAGPAPKELVEQGWRTFLVKVQNEAGVTASLGVESPQGLPLPFAKQEKLDDRWLKAEMSAPRPLVPELSGLALEYRLISLYSRDAGARQAALAFHVGPGTRDIGFRDRVDLLFTCRPAVPVAFRVLDHDGSPTTACFTIRDAAGRVYPPQSKRLAPDFFFHPQIYRGDGETVSLPPGEYTIAATRGPEYLEEIKKVAVTGQMPPIEFKLARWIDPATKGWWSGDHHIHAAGCSHYHEPTQGVSPADMMRHCLGEDLKIGNVLTWGPCFDFQKRFFTGAVDERSKYPYLMRYDIEVSGFGSHKSGHLCLLNLKEQIYPGGDSSRHWPTLCLNTLKWAKKQGAVCGFPHTGWGLAVESRDLPNFDIPPYNGIGANEYIVDVAHEVPGPDGKPVPAVDFISALDTPPLWELNIWYHTLNCGFKTRLSGETDFPCIYDERVGMGRSYVKVDGRLDYAPWCEGIRQGRSYVSDGRSHLMGFAVDGLPVGEKGSELALSGGGPRTVRVSAQAAARLYEKRPATLGAMIQEGEEHHRRAEKTPGFGSTMAPGKPFWHLERARIGTGRKVPVEVIVNGVPVARKEILADGSVQDLAFDVKIDKSSWIALRIFPSSHTNPVFVTVDAKPIRVSRKSAEWCLNGVDRCWMQKKKFISAREMKEAVAAYEHAREVYRRIASECAGD